MDDRPYVARCQTCARRTRSSFADAVGFASAHEHATGHHVSLACAGDCERTVPRDAWDPPEPRRASE